MLETAPQRALRVAFHALRALTLAWMFLAASGVAHAQCDPRRACCATPPPGGTPQCGQGGPAQQATSAPTAPGGNPIDVLTGNKHQREVDLPALPGVLGLELVRHYDSALSEQRGPLGHGWRLSYEATLRVGETALTVVQADGAALTFTRAVGEPDRFGHADPWRGTVVREYTAAREPYYVWRWPDGRRLRFDRRGRLETITAASGEFVSLLYGADGRLVRVVDPQGRQLGLLYDKRGRLEAVDTPVGRFAYGYAAELPFNLATVTLPRQPAVTRRYHYEDARQRQLLTGISVEGRSVDGKPTSERVVTWSYDERGWAVTSVKGDVKDNVERVSVQRKALVSGSGEATLTNSLGHATVYRWRVIAGQMRLVEAIGPGCASCGETNRRYRYDQLGRLVETTQLDDRGQPVEGTRHTLDGMGRVMRTTRVDYRDGKPSSERLRARYGYPSSATLAPTLIARPSVVAGREHTLRIDYNEAGQPTRVVEAGFSPLDEHGQPSAAGTPIRRTTTYAYRRINGRSLLAEIDGPLPNGPLGAPQDSDITRYVWDPRGDFVRSIAHPAGLQTRLEYDEAGRVRHYTGTDGVPVALEYAAGGALLRVDRAGAVSTYRRDALDRTGELITPIGQRLQFGYDTGLRLKTVRDAQGNRIELEHDSEGRLVASRLVDSEGTVAQHGASGPSPERDIPLRALHQLALATHEPGNVARPTQLTNPYAAISRYVDATVDREAASAHHVDVDSLGRATTSWRDDFGRIVLVRSPVTGDTRHVYDAADQPMKQVRHDGSRADYTRDAAGRVVSFKAIGAEGGVDEAATISWSRFNKPARVRYAAGEESFAYDDAARLVEHVQVVDGKRWAQRYRYDDAGRRVRHTLPGNRTLSYRYRGALHPRAGLLSSVWLNGVDALDAHGWMAGLLDRPVVQGLNDELERYGKRDFEYGNGLTHHLELDAQGRVVSAGNAQVGRTELTYAPPVATATTTTTVAVGAVAQGEAAQALTARMHGVLLGWKQTGAVRPLRAVLQTPEEGRLDRLGRQLSRADQALHFDSLNRLVEVKTSSGQPVARYRYNLFGQRIAKVVYGAGGESKVTYFFHDGAHLVAEADANGQVDRQYVWVNDKPVAVLSAGGALQAVHVDHRNAPLAVTDEARRVVWQAQVADFGHAAPSAGSIEFNLRLSNQYFDAETGLHYNTHRYYDPHSRRYISPDPMGLRAGPDLYAFALDRPHELADPLGLQPRSTVEGRLDGWSYEDRLSAIVQRSIPLLPGEIGSALLELVQPQNLATMGAVFALWAGSQFTPVGWIADLALLGTGIWYAGSGVMDLFRVFTGLHRNVQAARCASDLDAAARQLARGFVTVTGELAGGFSGTWGLVRTGALARIADGIRTVTNFGRRQIGAGALQPNAVSVTRPDTSRVVYGPDSRYRRSDGNWAWPPNDGFAGARTAGPLPPSTLVDRFGPETGSFLAPLGTPFEMRALPPASRSEPYYAYRVARGLPVQGGATARAFDQPGGGTQYMINWEAIARAEGVTALEIRRYPGGGVAWLVDMGYLERLVPPGGLR